jgi:hypothetical protein
MAPALEVADIFRRHGEAFRRATRAITRMRMSAEYAFRMVRPPDESMPPDSPIYRSLGILRFYSARTCSSRRLRGTIGAERPAMQQQQQIQPKDESKNRPPQASVGGFPKKGWDAGDRQTPRCQICPSRVSEIGLGRVKTFCRRMLELHELVKRAVVRDFTVPGWRLSAAECP